MMYCIHKGKREAASGLFMLTSECHEALAQVDLKGTRVTQQSWIQNGNWRYFQ